MNVVAMFGSIDGIGFDYYVTDLDFNNIHKTPFTSTKYV